MSKNARQAKVLLNVLVFPPLGAFVFATGAYLCCLPINQGDVASSLGVYLATLAGMIGLAVGFKLRTTFTRILLAGVGIACLAFWIAGDERWQIAWWEVLNRPWR